MTDQPTLRGAFTALVTPFTRDGELDEAALGRLLERQIEAGIDGLVPCGTTGESPTLSTSRARARHRARPSRPSTATRASGRIPVVAGTGHERHARHDRGHPARRRTRRGCRARRGALLQQARPAHARGALSRHRRRGRPARRRLQRARPHRHQRRCADAVLRLAEHERIIGRQGGLREPRADHDHPARPTGRASPSSPATTAGRCPLLGARRRRRHLRGLQRGARRSWSGLCAAARGRLGRRRGSSTSATCHLFRAQLREPQPGAGQGRARRDGPHRGRPAAAAPAARGARTRPAAGGPRRSWASRPGRRCAPWPHEPGARSTPSIRQGCAGASRSVAAAWAAPRPASRPPTPCSRRRRARSSTSSSTASSWARSARPGPTRVRPAAGASEAWVKSGILLAFRLPGMTEVA